MPQTTASFDAVLKEYYEGDIRELIPNKAPLLKQFEALDARDYGGRYVTYPLNIGRTQGAGWASEQGAIPSAGAAKFREVRIPMRYLYGRVKFTSIVMKLSEGAGKKSFAPAMQYEMDNMINTLQNERARAIWGDGRGILALINGTPTTTTVTVDSPGGFAGATNGARFMNDGMTIVAVNPTTGAIRSGVVTVSTVAAAGTSVTVSGSGAPSGWVDNDYLVRAMNTSITDVSDSSYQKESMGMAGLVDDGTNVATLFGVNRTTVPLFQSTVISSIGAWSQDVVQRMLDVIDQTSDGRVTELWMHHSARRAYVASLEADRRYTGADLLRPDGGTAAAKKGSLTFGGLPINEDRYCPYGSIFATDPSTFKRYVLEPGEWAAETGAILKQVGTGNSLEDSFEAYYRLFDNFAIDKPNTCGRGDGLSVSLAVAHIY